MLSKPWTLLLWPLYADRRRAIGIVAMAAVVMIGAAPFLGAGMSLVEGSRVYAEHWEFNSGLFALEQAAFGRQAAKALGALLWLGVAWPVMRAKGEDGAEVLRRAGLLIGVALLLSPVCNPWYVCWLLPLLCVHRSPAALAFTGLVMLSYAYYIEPVGEFDPAARVIEYGLLGLLLVWEGVSRDRQSLWEGLLASSGRP